jgi:hypothetical protein
MSEADRSRIATISSTYESNDRGSSLPLQSMPARKTVQLMTSARASTRASGDDWPDGEFLSQVKLAA